jgi:hypothetical protein
MRRPSGLNATRAVKPILPRVHVGHDEGRLHLRRADEQHPHLLQLLTRPPLAAQQTC